MDNAWHFFSYLKKFIPLAEEEFEKFIKPYLIERSFDKREILLKAGEVEEYLNFIVRGLVRKYYLNHKEEVNTQIAHEGHLIHAQESFHSRTPSDYFVEAIEPVILISISFSDLEKIYNHDVKLERLGRKVITYTMVQKDRWQMQSIKLTPRERFLLFVQHHPDLLQRVPQKQLASFLNIQPETFSRFKHLVKANK